MMARMEKMPGTFVSMLFHLATNFCISLANTILNNLFSNILYVTIFYASSDLNKFVCLKLGFSNWMAQYDFWISQFIFAYCKNYFELWLEMIFFTLILIQNLRRMMRNIIILNSILLQENC